MLSIKEAAIQAIIWMLGSRERRDERVMKILEELAQLALKSSEPDSAEQSTAQI